MKRDRLALRRRDDSVDADSGDTVYKINAKAPKYNKIKDWTNILTPETSRGPYFLPRSQTLRQDIREDEPGVPLSLEIGVIDVDTCDPLDSVLVDIWVQRAIHIHVQIHTNWTILSNGTLAHGSIVSTGQIFIDELLTRQLMALEPYVSHTEIERVKNADDGIYNQESATGAMTLLDTEPLDGKDYTKGVFGYITLGVQMSQIRNGSTIDALPEVPVPA
ncbi:hypothetical protein Neosp_004073 [[Neocosmospora] mangrovei]